MFSFNLMVLHVFLQVKDSDNLVDVAAAIIRNEISSVPIFKSLPDSSGMSLLNLATLQGILKCMILFYKTICPIIWLISPLSNWANFYLVDIFSSLLEATRTGWRLFSSAQSASQYSYWYMVSTYRENK